MIQDTFEWGSRPVARSTDPDTAHAAADSVRDFTKKQRAVWLVLERWGPCTDPDLAIHYSSRLDARSALRQSESGLRTRRSELVRKGLVRDTGERETLPSGRKAIIWAAV